MEGLKAFCPRRKPHTRPTANIARGAAKLQSILHLPCPETGGLFECFDRLVKRVRRGILMRLAALVPGSDLDRYLILDGESRFSFETTLPYIRSPGRWLFPAGSPVKILVETEHIRCAPHMGRVKCGGNYASAMPAWKPKQSMGAKPSIVLPEWRRSGNRRVHFIWLTAMKSLPNRWQMNSCTALPVIPVLTVAKDLGYMLPSAPLLSTSWKLRLRMGGSDSTGTAELFLSNFFRDWWQRNWSEGAKSAVTQSARRLPTFNTVWRR